MMLWYTARGAGLSALVLLSVATALGAYTTAAGRRAVSRRTVLQYVHRAAGGLGVGVLVLHVLTIVADSYAHVGVTGALVPFTSSFRATWVGLGTIAAYLLLLVAVLGYARGRLAATARGAAVWRTLHGIGYLAWGLGMLHGLKSGTDTGVAWVSALYLGCAALVATAVAFRLFAANGTRDRRSRRLIRAPAPVAGVTR
jgi:hypothetical protein